MKKMIVVGASSGIGREVARLYAEEGNMVAVTGRRAALLEELRREFPEKVITGVFDVRLLDNPRQLDMLVEQMGGMDICLISAGLGTVSNDLNWEIENETFETNVSAFTQVSAWAFNYFVRQGHGQLANISSIASLRGNSHAPAYSASKAYQSVYFEGLRMKAMRLGVPLIITDIQPGFVQTKTTQGNKRFWVASVHKAARQIKAGMDEGRFRFFVTRRWRLVAWLMKWMPDFIFHRIS
jgi:short-subunit dehydrogenase